MSVDALETDAADQAAVTIPRWTPEFDAETFDLQAVLREAKAQKKSAGKLLKSLGYPVAKFIALDVPEFKSADGAVGATASSTAIDLSGDDFDAGAIEQMRAAALGTTVFLNHSYDLPEDVYGKVASVEVARRTGFNPVTQQSGEMTCLDLQIAPVGEDENPRAVRVTNMLRKSQLKLGVSVTVLVLKSKTREDGGRTITHVFYIESSMVGIPCNQTAWAHAGAKAHNPKEAAMNTTETKTGATAPAPDTQAAPATPAPAVKSWFRQALEEATSKSVFSDVLDEKQNNFWIYVDSLSTVVSRLRREARGKDAAAQATLVSEFEASLADFVSEITEWMKSEISESAAAETTGGYYWECYSALGRLGGVLQKAGARNSQSDRKLLDQMHDALVELGSECKQAPEAGGEEAKSASLAGAGEGALKLAALQIERDELKRHLDVALDAAEEAAKQLELEKATAKAAVEALERYGREPLPRAGVSVS